jgi:hypothetical protein
MYNDSGKDKCIYSGLVLKNAGEHLNSKSRMSASNRIGSSV